MQAVQAAAVQVRLLEMEVLAQPILVLAAAAVQTAAVLVVQAVQVLLFLDILLLIQSPSVQD